MVIAMHNTARPTGIVSAARHEENEQNQTKFLVWK